MDLDVVLDYIAVLYFKMNGRVAGLFQRELSWQVDCL